MCIAIYKELGQPVQKKKMYKRCFDKNPDGAGYAWYKDEKDVWVVTKGLMNFKSFWRSFNRASRKYDFTNRQVLVHFRVGTSGNRKGPDCTHPFPVTPHLDLMRKLKFETRNLVAHNGVIGPGFGPASDTMIGVRDYIDLLWELKADDRAIALWKEHLKFEKCRWWMAEGAEVRMFGDWINSKTYESHFSNVGYRPDPPKQTSLPVQSTTSFVDTTHAVRTHRFYRHADFSEFCENGKWSWQMWADANKEYYAKVDADGDLTSPNEMMDYVECPASVMALLDKDGNILWDDDYSPAEDLVQCPSCMSEDLIESGLLNGDTGCKECGCVFQADTGDIIVYDPSICEDLTITLQCITCHAQTTLTEWGECATCGTIIDPTLAERRIKEQKNG